MHMYMIQVYMMQVYMMQVYMMQVYMMQVYMTAKPQVDILGRWLQSFRDRRKESISCVGQLETSNIKSYQTTECGICDLMAQRLARRAEDREVPGSSPTQD